MATRNKPRGALTVAAPIIFLAVLLAGWWLSTTLTGIEAWRLPDPLTVARKGLALLQRPATWRQIAVTGGEAIAGCALGTVVALPLAYAIYRWRLLAAAVEPFLGATQALPAIAIAPILVLWVGYGITPVIVLCALMVFFPILVSTVVVSIMNCWKLPRSTARRAGRWPHIWSYLLPPPRFWAACVTGLLCL